MEMPRNEFKRRINQDATLYGLWISLADPVAAEISAGSGADWVLIDGEHSPNDLRSMLAQLQATSAYPLPTLMRPPVGNPVTIKQYLDLGVQTLVVPMVESASQAAELVQATRYAPDGIRGVATTRSARWGRIDDYWSQANNETCLVCQIESQAGLNNLEAIAAVDGVDALFVGPSDLGADLGYLGDAGNPKVREAVTGAIGRIRATGTPAGVLSTNPEIAQEFADAGANFVAVGVDTSLLAKATTGLIDSFRTQSQASAAQGER